MPQQWKRVHVFVSSTFDDMHAERDYLAKRVYPELADWCERRRLRLIDVDLRWGVTEEEAAENRDALKICLERIDICRPFFVSLIGQRYGWIPRLVEVSQETFRPDRFPSLRLLIEQEKYSITELEIRHAAIGSFGVPRHRQAGEAAAHAFVYVRRKESLRSLPDVPHQLRHIYTDEGQPDAAQRGRALQELTDKTIAAAGIAVRSYRARWREDDRARTHELAMPYACPSRNTDAIGRWRKNWQTYAGIEVVGERFEQAADVRRAEAYNELLTRGRLDDFRVSDADGAERPLGETVLADLKQAIQAVYPDRVEVPTEEDDVQAELDAQEEFRRSHVEAFVERGDDLQRLDAFLHDTTGTRACALTGDAGVGKSTLLAFWIESRLSRVSGRHGPMWLTRFIGTGHRSSSSADEVIRSLTTELARRANLEGDIPVDATELRKQWPDWLEKAGRRAPTLIVLDGLDQLDAGLTDMGWLPLRPPQGVKLVVSYRRDAAGGAEFDERLSLNDCRLVEVGRFEQPADRRRLVETFLWQYLKRLDERAIEELIALPGATIPLFLRVVLSELRVFGAFDRLHDRIHEYGDTAATAFDGVLTRLESDAAPEALDSTAFVALLFGALSHARRGLTDLELADLIAAHYRWRNGPGDRPHRRDRRAERHRRAIDAISLYLRQLKSFVVRRGGRYDFFYQSFREAAARRYTDTRRRSVARPAEQWHQRLSDVFRAHSSPKPDQQWRQASRRSLNELAFHVSRSGDLRKTAGLYEDLGYLEAMCLSHAASGQGSPESHAGLFDLIANAQDALHFSWTPPAQGRPRRRYDGKILERLTHVERTLSLESHALSHWLHAEHPSYFAQQVLKRAIQLGADSLVRSAGARLARFETPSLVLRSRAAVETPGLERTLIGHAGQVIDIRIHPYRFRALSASDDGTLRLWDLATGREIVRFQGHQRWVTAVAVPPDWSRVISGGQDQTVRVWEIESGRCLRTWTGHRDQVSAVAITPDGQRIVSGGKLGEMHFWNVADGSVISPGQAHAGRVTCIKLDGSGRRVVSASTDRTLKVWDVSTGGLLSTLTGHRGSVETIDVSSVGPLAVSGSFDEETNLRLWDIDTGQPLHAIVDHFARVDSVSLIHDANVVVTTSQFSPYISFWDVHDRHEYLTLSAAGNVAALAVAPAAQRAVTIAGGHLQCWNLLGGTLRCDIAGFEIGARTVAIDPTGGLAVTGEFDGTLRLWNLDHQSHAVAPPATSHTQQVTATRVLPDGARVVTASDDATLRIWDVTTGRTLHVLNGHRNEVRACALTPDSRYVVSGSTDRVVRVWDAETGRSVHALEGHSRPSRDHVPGAPVGPTDPSVLKEPSIVSMLGRVNAVALTPDGRLAVSASADYTLRVWNVASGTLKDVLHGHTTDVRDVAAMPDGRHVLSASWDKTLKLWDLTTGRCVHTFEGHTGELKRVVVSADGRTAASIANHDAIRVWDVAGRRQAYVLEGDDRWDSSRSKIALAADGRHLVACGGPIAVWDLRTGVKVGAFGNHEGGAATALLVTPDSRFAIASWIEEPSVEIWDLEHGTRAAVIDLEQVVTSLALVPASMTIVAGGSGGNVSFVDVVGL